MLEPISARLASSFSRNGIMDVATENTIFGDTSIKSMERFWKEDRVFLEKHYLFPIPTEELQRANIPQNPNW